MTSSVCAVVLTYNRPALLRVCLGHLLAQTRPPDEILVVDNASTDDTVEMLARDFPGVRVLALPVNVGAAGGFEAGMARAYAAGFDWLWLMDDDAYPQPDALERLLAPPQGGPAAVRVPLPRGERGEFYGLWHWDRGRAISLEPESLGSGSTVPLFAFIGPLVSRSVVERIGLPYGDYFIDTFDLEYGMRLQQAGLRAALVPGSVIDHQMGQVRRARRLGLGRERDCYWGPEWRLYYSTRNTLLTVRRRDLGIAALGQALVGLLRDLLRDFIYWPLEWNRRRVWALAVVHGLRGVSGEVAHLQTPSTFKAQLRAEPAPPPST